MTLELGKHTRVVEQRWTSGGLEGQIHEAEEGLDHGAEETWGRGDAGDHGGAHDSPGKAITEQLPGPWLLCILLILKQMKTIASFTQYYHLLNS